MNARAREGPRRIYVATEDWYFLSHCLPMARAARAAGFEVHVLANVTEDAANLGEEGFILHAVPFGHGKLSPFRNIAVLPSRGGGGVPKSLLEAAAFGRPLIATDVPGCREIVIHEKTGLLVPVDDPQGLASAILRLVRSPPQRVRFGVAARRLVDERFAADLVGQATVDLYRRLLAS